MSEKIHFVHYDSGPGGIEVLLPLIIKSMHNYCFSVFTIRPRQNGHGVYDNMDIKLEYGSNRNLIAFVKIFAYAKRFRKETFHVFNIGPVFLFILRLAGVRKIVYSIHGTIYWKTRLKKKLLLFFWRKAITNKVVFIANSQHSKNEFLKKINSKVKVKVVYNPIVVGRNDMLGHSQDKGILIIYSGRLEEGKNLPKWIDVAVRLHSMMPQTHFEIYGEGSLKESLFNQIKGLNAEEYIHLRGYRKDIGTIYRKADLLLFLSQYESFGNVVVESILCGTPVLTLPIPSMTEIFAEYSEFILDTNADLGDQLYSRLQHLDDLKKIACRARESFGKRFSLCNHLKSLEEVYEVPQ